MIYHDDNGASLQPQDEREGCLAFTRAMFVSYCLAGSAIAVAVGAIGALMGAW